MAEQISHKKSLKLNKQKADKRLLLKEYYKLDDKSQEPEPQSKEDASESVEDVVQQDDDGEKPISQLSFQELLRIHNNLLREETETNSSIKNTIYDNYYDLIKVENLLSKLITDEHPQLDKLKANLGMISKN